MSHTLEGVPYTPDKGKYKLNCKGYPEILAEGKTLARRTEIVYETLMSDMEEIIFKVQNLYGRL